MCVVPYAATFEKKLRCVGRLQRLRTTTIPLHLPHQLPPAAGAFPAAACIKTAAPSAFWAPCDRWHLCNACLSWREMVGLWRGGGTCLLARDARRQGSTALLSYSRHKAPLPCLQAWCGVRYLARPPRLCTRGCAAARRELAAILRGRCGGAPARAANAAAGGWLAAVMLPHSSPPCDRCVLFWTDPLLLYSHCLPATCPLPFAWLGSRSHCWRLEKQNWAADHPTLLLPTGKVYPVPKGDLPTTTCITGWGIASTAHSVPRPSRGLAVRTGITDGRCCAFLAGSGLPLRWRALFTASLDARWWTFQVCASRRQRRDGAWMHCLPLSGFCATRLLTGAAPAYHAACNPRRISVFSHENAGTYTPFHLWLPLCHFYLQHLPGRCAGMTLPTIRYACLLSIILQSFRLPSENSARHLGQNDGRRNGTGTCKHAGAAAAAR